MQESSSVCVGCGAEIHRPWGVENLGGSLLVKMVECCEVCLQERGRRYVEFFHTAPNACLYVRRYPAHLRSNL